MRMWMTDPSQMCRKHLLGEHVELHMLEGSLRRSKSLGRFLTGGLLNPAAMQERHTALVQEMERRGYTHRSPLAEIGYTGAHIAIDVQANRRELARRCPDCALLQDRGGV